MTFVEKFGKFNDFLTNLAESCGVKDLCEAVRQAACACFESDLGMTAEELIAEMKKGKPYKEIHRTMFKGNPVENWKKKVLARKAAEKPAEYSADDPVGTDAPKDEAVESPSADTENRIEGGIYGGMKGYVEWNDGWGDSEIIRKSDKAMVLAPVLNKYLYGQFPEGKWTQEEFDSCFEQAHDDKFSGPKYFTGI